MLVTKITSKAQAKFYVPCYILFGLSIDIIKEYLKLLNRLYDIINLAWVSLRLINREAVYEKRKLTQNQVMQV